MNYETIWKEMDPYLDTFLATYVQQMRSPPPSNPDFEKYCTLRGSFMIYLVRCAIEKTKEEKLV